MLIVQLDYLFHHYFVSIGPEKSHWGVFFMTECGVSPEKSLDDKKWEK